VADRCLCKLDFAAAAKQCCDAVIDASQGLFFDASCQWQQSQVREKGQKSIIISFEVSCSPDKVSKFQEEIIMEANKYISELLPLQFRLEDIMLPETKPDAWRITLEHKLGCNIELLHDENAMLITSDGRLTQEEIEQCIIRIARKDPAFVVNTCRPESEVSAAIGEIAHGHKLECRLQKPAGGGKKSSLNCDILVWPTPWTLPAKFENICSSFDKKVQMAQNALDAAVNLQSGTDESDTDEVCSNVDDHASCADISAKAKLTKLERVKARMAIRSDSPDIKPQLIKYIIDDKTRVQERSKRNRQLANKRQMWQRNKDTVRANKRADKEDRQQCC